MAAIESLGGALSGLRATTLRLVVTVTAGADDEEVRGFFLGGSESPLELEVDFGGLVDLPKKLIMVGKSYGAPKCPCEG